MHADASAFLALIKSDPELHLRVLAADADPVAIANELGHAITAADLVDAVGELGLDELDAVAGGRFRSYSIGSNYSDASETFNDSFRSLIEAWGRIEAG